MTSTNDGRRSRGAWRAHSPRFRWALAHSQPTRIGPRTRGSRMLRHHAVSLRLEEGDRRGAGAGDQGGLEFERKGALVLAAEYLFCFFLVIGNTTETFAAWRWLRLFQPIPYLHGVRKTKAVPLEGRERAEKAPVRARRLLEVQRKRKKEERVSEGLDRSEQSVSG